MRPDMIFGQMPRDLACAIALGMVEAPRVGINVQSITLLDAQMRPADKVDNWLDGDDPLDVATRDYLRARQNAVNHAAAILILPATGARCAHLPSRPCRQSPGQVVSAIGTLGPEQQIGAAG